MLVLSRRVGEKIRIGGSIVVTVLRIDSKKARLGVEAPCDLPIYRQEVFDFVELRQSRGNFEETQKHKRRRLTALCGEKCY